MKKLFISLFLICFSFSVFGVSYEYKSPTSKKQREDKSTSVVIKANVSNAEVYLNGNYQGKTDLTLNGLAPGYYNIEVAKDGYDSACYRIQVKRGYTLTYNFSLRKQVGYLNVKDLPSDALVYVDGSRKKVFPVELDVGSHTLKIKRFGYEEIKHSVDIKNRKTLDYKPSFEIAPFRVSDFKISKKAINPSYSNGLGIAVISFEVTNNGSASINILDEFDNTVWSAKFDYFNTWEQQIEWRGTDYFDERLSDGKYYIHFSASGGYVFDGEIVIDSTLTYPVVSYTPSGAGIGTVPALLSVSKSYVMPFIQAEGVFAVNEDSQGFYGAPVTAGILFNLFECLDIGIAGGGVVGVESDNDSAPFNVLAHIKGHYDKTVNDSLSLKIGALFRYGYAGMNLYSPYVFDKGNGLSLGLLGGLETKHFYAGLDSEYIWGSETGNITTEAQLWKNAITLAIKPKQWIRLGSWCGLHCVTKSGKNVEQSSNGLELNAIDTGIEYAMVPNIAALSFNLKFKALFFMDNTNYLSGSFGLSYLF